MDIRQIIINTYVQSAIDFGAEEHEMPTVHKWSEEYAAVKLVTLGLPSVSLDEQSEATVCEHPRDKRTYIGRGLLRCHCGKIIE